MSQRQDIPGWEGSTGPGPGQYGRPHVYARDVTSGAGNCVCGRDLGDGLHVQAAPGVPVPARLRHGRPPSQFQDPRARQWPTDGETAGG